MDKKNDIMNTPDSANHRHGGNKKEVANQQSNPLDRKEV